MSDFKKIKDSVINNLDKVQKEIDTMALNIDSYCYDSEKSKLILADISHKIELSKRNLKHNKALWRKENQ